LAKQPRDTPFFVEEQFFLGLFGIYGRSLRFMGVHQCLEASARILFQADSTENKKQTAKGDAASLRFVF